ncbi:hypothetical protein NP493_4519g00001 [Ridgeia piscesae]|uniref:Uncharacterized protein n=1 Tax=Ridgeia piscesae TaxID=27915 RepID=A0AAD9IZ78_RIDPI|nr:hypothetical protein NP493_4519g00001 [Ridgeia piscesae]
MPQIIPLTRIASGKPGVILPAPIASGDPGITSATTINNGNLVGIIPLTTIDSGDSRIIRTKPTAIGVTTNTLRVNNHRRMILTGDKHTTTTIYSLHSSSRSFPVHLVIRHNQNCV